ncbi:hypothetical protein [Xylophilus ampelinus]|uniref:Uncharacterized protein n=1 Tax=Xylophilus ampelinus TaxID=54067 RepID=A0A318SQY7_9BURK|nr:hypothetical protein [Xylophilus ampelinus]MCS4509123.1 hypothetical protein [Xylophilus ampelinus]PYE79849.1 hypothetical protein DFQ15_101169 [Xylophilus ampelinus]
MAAFDWKKLVNGLAPTLGTALLGPLGGMAFKTIAAAVTGNADASEDQVAEALANGSLNGDQIVALRAANQQFELDMQRLQIDLAQLNAQTELAYVADTSNARAVFGGNENVFVMGVCILVSFAVLMAAVLLGCFLLMTGYFKVDPNVAAICSGLIGTVVGYVASNAQQVVSYFYGNNKGSKDNGAAIATALTDTIKQAGAR